LPSLKKTTKRKRGWGKGANREAHAQIEVTILQGQKPGEKGVEGKGVCEEKAKKERCRHSKCASLSCYFGRHNILEKGSESDAAREQTSNEIGPTEEKAGDQSIKEIRLTGGTGRKKKNLTGKGEEG